MKVRLSYTVEVDPKSWATEYGVEPSEVRDDVKRYAEDAVLQQLLALGLRPA